MNAFATIVNLQSLDLSFNFLEEFDYRIFENNIKLERLDLSGNNFMTLANRPFVKSNSLKNLIMKETKLLSIHQQLFTELPNLTILDISQNHLKTIENMSVFSKLKLLEIINVENNEWICDKKWKSFLKWFKIRNIRVQRNQCCK